MRVSRFVVLAAVAALTASYAQAQSNVLVRATVKATTFSASGGKIVKKTSSNVNLVSHCTSTAGAQLVAEFSTNTLSIAALDVVDPCGNVICQIATFSSDTCVDTGVVNGKEELVCPISISISSGGDGFLVSDTKLTFGGSGDIKSGLLKATGVFVDSDGNPGNLSITVSGGFKPASNCPQ